jgi:hypothetical protein
MTIYIDPYVLTNFTSEYVRGISSERMPRKVIIATADETQQKKSF